jgi:hypothetical protein
MTGGAAGGGLPTEHWCAEHDPTLSPDYVWPEWDESDDADDGSAAVALVLAGAADGLA